MKITNYQKQALRQHGIKWTEDMTYNEAAALINEAEKARQKLIKG